MERLVKKNAPGRGVFLSGDNNLCRLSVADAVEHRHEIDTAGYIGEASDAIRKTAGPDHMTTGIRDAVLFRGAFLQTDLYRPGARGVPYQVA